MTDRDRLIELLKETETNPEKTCPHHLEPDCFDCPYDKGEDCDHEARKADFLLANGVILLPLPIGSTVYEIRAKGERSYKHRKFDYGIPTNFALHSAIEMGAELYIAPKKFTKTDTVRLNKTVFITKEEAEAELQKRGKENA